MAAPQAQPGQELKELRTETTKTFATETPGELETKLFAEPVHYRDAQGTWRDIDTDLKKTPKGDYAGAANSLGITVANQADAAALTRVDLGRGAAVSWRLGDASGGPRAARGAAKVPPAAGVAAAVKGPSATFHGALPGVDVKVTSRATGVKEDLLLAGPDAPSTYTFPLTLTGLSAQLQPGGAVALSDPAGRVRATIPTGWMQDAEGVTSAGVTYALLPAPSAGHGPVLQVSLDTAWLADPARAFPVTVDPSLDAGAAADDTFVSSGLPSFQFSDSSMLLVGSKTSGGSLYRSFLHFDVSALKGKTIDSAEVRAYNTASTVCSTTTVKSYQVTQAWTGSTTVWPGPATNTEVGSSDYFGSAGTSGLCGPKWVNTPVSQVVRRWTTLDPSLSQPNYGLMLSAPNDPSTTADDAAERDPQYYGEFASSETAASGTAPYLHVSWRQPVLGRLGYYTMNDTPLTDRATLSVNAANGNLLLSAQDLSVPGRNGFGVQVNRSYNSREDDTRQGAPGTGWTLSTAQDIRLSVNGMDQSAFFEGPSGYRMTFYWNRQTQSYDTPAGLNATLTKSSSGYTVTMWDSATKYNFGGTYSGDGLASMENFSGQKIFFDYDMSSHVVDAYDTQGDKTLFAYTAGLLASVTDPHGRAVTYAYTGTDLTSSTDQSGAVTGYTYDGNHNLTSITDPRGKVTTIAYDTSDRVASITWADSTSTTAVKTSYSYPSATQTTYTDAVGGVTTYTFASNGRGELSTVVSPKGQKSTRAYNPNSSVTGYTTPQGGTGSVTYAGGGYNVSGTSSPTGSRTSYSYTDPNAPNRPSNSTSASGVTGTYSWNAAYQPTSSQAGTAGTSRSSYTVSGCAGAVSSTVDAKGGTTTYAYDSRCRLVTTTPPAPLGQVTQTWDADDRVATSTDGKGNKQVFTYDALDRVTKTTYYAPGATRPPLRWRTPTTAPATPPSRPT